MKPILFSLGPIHIYSFGFMIVLGVFISLQLIARRVGQGHFLTKDHAFDLVFVTLAGGFAGGRLAYVIQFRDWYLEHPAAIFAVWEGGLIYYGGVIGAILALLIYSKARKYALSEVLDFLLPYVALSQAFGRVGCFLNGCCGGKVCDLPWGIRVAGHEETVHPTQLYEAFFTLGLFFFLSHVYQKSPRKGTVAVLYFSIYAVGRFVIEFFREGNPYFYFFTWNQWLSIVILISSLAAYSIFIRRHQKGTYVKH